MLLKVTLLAMKGTAYPEAKLLYLVPLFTNYQGQDNIKVLMLQQQCTMLQEGPFQLKLNYW